MNSNTKRFLSLLLTVVMLFGMLPVAGVSAAGTSVNIAPGIDRIYGDNRYETAFAVADVLKASLGVEKFESVVVSYGREFADALAGSYLAIAKKAPILLISQYNQDQVKEYIRANLAEGGTVYLLGGTAVVPESMESGLDGFQVKRLAGANRLGTNLAILNEVPIGNKDLLVCTGWEYADALSASATGLPILLLSPRGLTNEQKTFLEGVTGNIIICGGTSAVSADVEAQLAQYGQVERLAGANRNHTSVLVAERCFANPTNVVLAYGRDFPDGLCGGVLANVYNCPVILTQNNSVDQARNYVLGHGITEGVVLGGSGLISNGAVNEIFFGEFDENSYADEIVDEALTGSDPGASTVYSITDLELEDETATVTVNAVDDVLLYLEVIEDDEYQNITAEGAANVDAGVELEEVTVQLEGYLPEYFYIRATLKDMEGNQKATFTFVEFSRAYEEFQNQTIDSFPGRTVINFDEDPTDNFGVVAETVVQVDCSAGGNSMTLDANGNYQFANGAAGVANLEAGEPVLVYSADGEPHLLKVDTVTTNADGSVTIVPETEEILLQEFYDVLKVDMEIDIDDTMIDTSEATEGVTLRAGETRNAVYSGNIAVEGEASDTLGADVEVEGDHSVTLGFDIDVKISDHWKVTGALNGSLKAKLEIIYDIKLFSEDFFHMEFSSGIGGQLDVDLKLFAENAEPSGEGKEVFNIKFGKVKVPFGVTGLQGVIEPTVPVEWLLEGGATFEVEFTNTSGFVFETGQERQDIEEKSVDVTIGLEGKAEVKVGPKIVLGVTFLETVVKAEISGHAGAKAVGEIDLTANGTTGDSVHSCALCIDAEVSGFAEAKVELKYKISDRIKGTPFSLKILDYSIHLFDCYVSLINSSDSIFGGYPHFGLDDCPNHKWKASFRVEDQDGNMVSSDVSLLRIDNNKSAGWSMSGGYKHLYAGNYKATATVDGNTVEKRFSISDEPVEVVLSPSARDGSVSGTVSEADDHSNYISGASVKICQGNTVCATTSTNASGHYSVKMPAGNYTVHISADGYLPFTCEVTVTENNDVHTPTFLMIDESEVKYGGVSGTIYDALTGDPLDGVSLIFRKGWNNTSGDFAYGLTTDYYGYYEYELRNFLGAKIGMEVGNYTVTASKDGYVTSYFNVVILPDETTGNQNSSLTPEVVEGDYRIVLTWGSNPRDLDSHYRALTKEGYTEHVYFSNMWTNSAQLDVDDTSSYGPETTTIMDFSNIAEFTFSVYDYTNGGDSSNTELASSGAVVQLYKGAELLRTYNVPGSGVGDTWHVFRIKSDGSIIGINTFCTTSGSSRVGSELFGSVYASENSGTVYSAPGTKDANK